MRKKSRSCRESWFLIECENGKEMMMVDSVIIKKWGNNDKERTEFVSLNNKMSFSLVPILACQILQRWVLRWKFKKKYVIYFYIIIFYIYVNSYYLMIRVYLSLFHIYLNNNFFFLAWYLNDNLACIVRILKLYFL